MSDEAIRQAANVVPPVMSDVEGEGVTILTATTTAANAAIPRALFNRYVVFQAEGDKIWLSFCGSAEVENVDKSKAGGATFAAGKDDQNGVPIPDGGRLEVRLDEKLHAKVTWQANASNSKLIVYPSSQARQRGR